MHTNPLRVRWAGPAVAGALLVAALTPRPAAAAPVTWTPSVRAARMEILCAKEAYDYLVAWQKWLSAWNNYQLTLPGGTESEIMDAATLLDQATANVGQAGAKLVLCLLGQTSKPLA
jgi:hypothetical protein